MTLAEPDGATPLDPDERQGLLYDHITTRGELDELEQANIEQGLVWAMRQRRANIFDDAFIRRLHKQLFGDVWTWAGRYRLTEKKSVSTPGRFPFSCGYCSMTRVIGRSMRSIRHWKPRHGTTTGWCKSIPSPTVTGATPALPPTSCWKESIGTR